MLIDDIRALIAAPTPAAPRQFLARVDVTLTDGYAHTLQLEAEHARLERRMAGILATRPADTDELAGLAERMTLVNERTIALLTLLRTLRERRAEIRRAA